jgi:hypothetical protein
MRSLHKKGQNATVLFAIIIFIMLFGFFTIFSYYFVVEYSTAMNATEYYPEESQELTEGILYTLRLFDYALIGIVMAMIIGLAITSYRVASEGVFFIVMLVSGIFYGYIAYFFNYLFQQLVSDAIFTATLQYFPLTVLICSNLHWVMLLEIIVGSIALWGKKPEPKILT